MEIWQLKQFQSLPLEAKVIKTERMLREWSDKFGGDIYISFSGGKDSSVLLDIARSIFPKIQAMYVDTGLEYPEVKQHVKTIKNVETVRPNLSFFEVINKYGYPVVSKEQSQFIYQYRNANSEKTKDTRLNGNKYGRGKISEKWKKLIYAPFKISDKCCDIMKKNPAKKFEKETGLQPVIGVLAVESSKRIQDYLKFGCNAFDAKRPISRPIGFWTEHDVLEYIKLKRLSIPSVYGEIIETPCGLKLTGVDRTGCMFCAFGAHLEKGENRFERMAKTHPQIHEYCMNQLGMKEVLDFVGIRTGCNKTQCLFGLDK